MTATVVAISLDRFNHRKTLASAAALVALVFLAHGLALWGAFIWDDLELIVHSPLIHASDGLWRFWFTTQAPDYFPLTSTTWWFEWRIWGDHPAGYHLINLLLHAISAVLIWQILVELKLPGAWLAAAIWAVHPVQVESVAWIAEGKNTLSVALAAASLLLFLRFHESNRRATYLWALLAFIAALLAKTAVAPLVVVMFACAIWNSRNIRRALLETISFAVITVALCVVTIYFQSQRAIASDVVRADGLASRIAIAGRAVWFYLGKLICPMPLDFVYPRWPTSDVSPHVFVPLLLLMLTIILLWLSKRKWGRGPLLAMAYFVLMLLPVLGLLNIYFMRYSLVADHWQYTASIGPIALFAATVSRVQPRFQWAIGIVVILFLSILSEQQAWLYRSGESLWNDTIAKNPTSWMAQMNLGHTFAFERRYAEAEIHYRAAAALAPELAEPHYSIGSIDAQQGRFSDAVTEYQQATDRNPNVAAIYLDMAHALAEINRTDEAKQAYEKAMKLQRVHR
jgi:tetratricopeptide (TPR) repeat protein